MLSMTIQTANSKSARKKKKQPRTPNVLLSVHLSIAARSGQKKKRPPFPLGSRGRGLSVSDLG
jgi:hypothetical protein